MAATDIETEFILDPEACTQCNECLDACPNDAIELTSDDIYIDPDTCDGCEDCALVCPTTAIQVGDPALALARARSASDVSNVVPLQRRRDRHDRAPWRLTDVAIGLVVVLALALAQRALELPAYLQGFSGAGPHVVLTLWMLFFYSVVVVTVLVLAGRRHAVIEDLGVRAFKWLPAIGYSVGALLVVRLLTGIYAVVASGAGMQGPAKIEVQVLRWFGFGPTGFLLAVLVTVVIAPAAEELFFRGFVYGALRERIGIIGAIVASSLIFALYHANLWLIIPVMFLGMALAWLFESQRSLGPPLLFHALYNFLAVVQVYFFSTGR